MNQTVRSKISSPGSTEAVTFTDGMLVTAEDLNAATRYPLEVVQVLLRAYFGCGIVCGLGVKRHDIGNNPDGTVRRDFAVEIGAGVALDCGGYPIELCESLTLDFRPDPCGCPIDGEEVRYIAIRRFTAPEAPARGCGCGPAAGEPGQQCSRLRDRVLIQAFDEAHLPAGICMRPIADGGDDAGICECLARCPDCDRCADPWVLLATVIVDEGGVMLERINADDDVDHYGGPQPVKPIACLCGGEDRSRKRLSALEQRLQLLEGPQAAVPQGPRGAAAPAGQPQGRGAAGGAPGAANAAVGAAGGANAGGGGN